MNLDPFGAGQMTFSQGSPKTILQVRYLHYNLKQQQNYSYESETKNDFMVGFTTT